jgi:hypothetical protein
MKTIKEIIFTALQPIIIFIVLLITLLTVYINQQP